MRDCSPRYQSKNKPSACCPFARMNRRMRRSFGEFHMRSKEMKKPGCV
jgi:hypothetical protein